jgi:hypothetical protein
MGTKVVVLEVSLNTQDFSPYDCLLIVGQRCFRQSYTEDLFRVEGEREENDVTFGSF